MEDELIDTAEKDETLVDIADLEKTEASKAESTVNTIMTIESDQPQAGQNTSTASVVLLSSATDGQHAPSGRVKVLIKYPKDWKTPKHLRDGDIKDIAPETAAQFIKAGFATLVKEDKSK
jgi:hypothetical protein